MSFCTATHLLTAFRNIIINETVWPELSLLTTSNHVEVCPFWMLLPVVQTADTDTIYRTLAYCVSLFCTRSSVADTAFFVARWLPELSRGIQRRLAAWIAQGLSNPILISKFSSRSSGQHVFKVRATTCWQQFRLPRYCQAPGVSW